MTSNILPCVERHRFAIRTGRDPADGSMEDHKPWGASADGLLGEGGVVARASFHGMREDIIMDIHQILAPTDVSDYSKQAVTYAHELAQTFGAKLLLLHVVELPAYLMGVFLPSAEGTTLLDDLERQARLDLAHLLPKAKRAKVDVMSLVAVGTPPYKIVEVAEA